MYCLKRLSLKQQFYEDFENQIKIKQIKFQYLLEHEHKDDGWNAEVDETPLNWMCLKIYIANFFL